VVKLSDNKRRSGRSRKKEDRQSGVELQEIGLVQRLSNQEVEGSVETETEKEQTPVEMEGSEPKLIFPEQPEPEQPIIERVAEESAKQSTQLDLKPEAGQKSGGNRVADNRENVLGSFTKMSESVFGFEGVKKAAAWYIETSEKLANQAIELQERATGWAKDTPLGPLFEAQQSIARRFVERSANAARTLWQIQPSE
jgi:hypothetical protein